LSESILSKITLRRGFVAVPRAGCHDPGKANAITLPAPVQDDVLS